MKALYTTQLRYLITIAQLENVSQAAQLLHMFQSSFSKNLAKLETELGIPLFDRSGKKLTLNTAGARLLVYSPLSGSAAPWRCKPGPSAMWTRGSSTSS